MTAPITNQSRLNKFFPVNVTGDPGAPALLVADIPAWMKFREGFKGIDQLIAWGTDAANETAIVSMYYAWDLTDPALEVGAAARRGYLIREAVEFTWTLGALVGVAAFPILDTQLIADTVVPVKKSAQDYIETLTGTALSVESPTGDGIAMVGMPNLGNVVAFGFRRTGGTSASSNLAVQLGNGRN